MNAHEFEDRLEALRPRFHRYCAHDGIGGLLAELRLRPNIVEAALVINLRVLIMSSGASMVLAVPFIAPRDLRLSGGYTGAKRMLWFMAHSANSVSSERGLMLHFQVLVPCQLIPGTTLGRQVAAAYAEIEGVSIDEHVMQRYGSILRPARVGEQVAELLGDPRYTQGIAYGFPSNGDILPLDV